MAENVTNTNFENEKDALTPSGNTESNTAPKGISESGGENVTKDGSEDATKSGGKGVKWTPMQKLAIDTRDKTLLISAAAGSGKTATLTERIVQSIIVDEINISEMLIVTFTRSAAAQLREKIGKAIRKKLSAVQGATSEDERKKRDHLEKQLYSLPSAKICTIDSFCTDILRANADRVNISAGFRIPDGAECALIGERILDGIFHDIYSGSLCEVATPEELSSLADCLTDTGKDSTLSEIISAIYLSTVSTIKGVESFTELINEYEPSKFTTVEATNLGKYVMSRLHEMAEYFSEEFKKAEWVLLSIPQTSKTRELADMMAGYKDLANLLLKEESYTAARETVAQLISNAKKGATILPGTAKYPKTASNTNPDLPQTTDLAKYFRNSVEKDISPFFAHSEEEWKIAYAGLYREFHTLLRLLRRYDEELRKEKARRNICEFSDIERYTYECLWKDGRRTDIAEAQSKLFAQIYIDEYQDVNDLQDKIFEAISTPTNRFMVGDIKQSIYRFRGGNPEIFSRMKGEYPELSVAKSSPRAVIFMSDNFRCDRGIVDFTNLIFDRVFGFIGESIGYVTQDRLHCSKYSRYPEAEPPYKKPEVCLIDSASIVAAHKGEENWDAKMIGPYVVAEKIRELCANGVRMKPRLDEKTGEPILDPETGKPIIDEVPIKEGDIAILMRKAKERINNYKRALDEYGIPNAIAEDTRFFLTAEALLALCLLNAIDNPHRDVYLAGLMLSPLYSFTEDELALIKKKTPDPNKKRGWEVERCTLYTSLTNYVNEHPEYEKGKKFIKTLEHYRVISQGLPTDALLLRLYNDTGILALASKKGTKNRLLRLYEYARSFEAGSYKGLYNFISYINSIVERKNSLDKREAPSDPDAVKIVTSHGSKGLEYPIVFYVGTEDELGNDMNPPRFEYAEGFGIGMHLRSKSGVALVKNPTKHIIRDYEKRREFEEEARILYVALTRAEEQLYIVTPTTVRRQSIANFQKDVSFTREHLGKYPIYGAESMSRLMFISAALGEKDVDEFLEEVPDKISLLVGNDDSGEGTEDGKEAEGITEGSGTQSTDIHGEKEIKSAGATDEKDRKNGQKSDTGQRIAKTTGFRAPTDTRAGEFEVTSRYRPDQIYPEMQKRFNYEYPRLYLTRLPEKVSVSALYPRLLDGTDEGVTAITREAMGQSTVVSTELFTTDDGAAEIVFLDGDDSYYNGGVREPDGFGGTAPDGSDGTNFDGFGGTAPDGFDGRNFDGFEIFGAEGGLINTTPIESVTPPSDSEGTTAPTPNSDTADEDERKRIDKALHFRGLGIKPKFISGVERDSAAKRGISTHLLFQFCNLSRLKNEGASAEISHLVKEKYLSEEDKKRIETDRLSEVEAFRHSALIDRMIDAESRGELYREFRFNLLFPADMFVSDPALKEKYAGEKILVQGVIDCLYVDRDGEYHLIDYKTDRLTENELNDRREARFTLCKSHARQLAYYGMAVEKIFGKKPATREVYSLHLGDTVSVVTRTYP